MRNIINITILSFFALGALCLPMAPAIAADTPLENLEAVGGEDGAGYADYQDDTFDKVIGGVVSAFLSLLGIIFIVLILYGGYKWMTAAGDEQKVELARKTITQAIIGLIIVVGAYAIWQFISDALFGVVT